MRDAQQSVHLVAATVGFLSYVLLWISALWGIVLRNGWALTRMRHGTLYGIHQTVTLVALTLAMVHALAQLAAPGGSVRLIDQVVPFVNPVDPIGIGLGVIALELLIAIALSVLIQRWLGYHRWRRMHTLGYLAYVLVSLHLLISGSDTTSIFVRIPIVLSVVALFMAASGNRIAKLWGHRSPSGDRRQVRDSVVSVDPSRCIRYGFCVQEAPALFRLQSDGRLSYRAAVAPELLDDAVRAAEACPARAVMVRRRAADGAGPGSQIHHQPAHPALPGPSPQPLPPVPGPPQQPVPPFQGWPRRPPPGQPQPPPRRGPPSRPFNPVPGYPMERER